MPFSIYTLFYAFLGGLLPALVWLWFFMHEDPHPEPRSRLIKTFLIGMVTVGVAILLERVAQGLLTNSSPSTTLLSWSIIEEVLKYGGAWLVALRTPIVDEPVDALIYMLAVGLGFAALENSLFLLAPLADAAYLNTVVTGGFRFIGATLVHVISSGALGACLALSFYRRRYIQRRAIAIGLVLAVALHWGFNLLIMNTPQQELLYVFALVWTAVIGIMLAFERAKRVHPPSTLSS